MSAWIVFSLLFARAFETQCCLRPNLKALGCDFSAAPHTLSVGAILNSHQPSLHRGDLARDERGLHQLAAGAPIRSPRRLAQAARMEC